MISIKKFVILILLSVFLISGCDEAFNAKDYVKLYFIKTRESNFAVSPVWRKNELIASTQGLDLLKIHLIELFKGPSEKEQEKSFFTEIPVGTRLLSITEDKSSIYINLSQNFISGGGSLSMMARWKQLFQTIKDVNSEKEIVVLIEGVKTDSIGGEGYVLENPIKTAEDTQKDTPKTEIDSKKDGNPTS